MKKIIAVVLAALMVYGCYSSNYNIPDIENDQMELAELRLMEIMEAFE